jgi:hypothetical protein
LSGVHVGEIAAPDLVGTCRFEATFDEIREGGRLAGRDGGTDAPPGSGAHDAGYGHEAGDATAAALHALVLELGIDARRAVGAVGVGVCLSDLGKQHQVVKGAVRYGM